MVYVNVFLNAIKFMATYLLIKKIEFLIMCHSEFVKLVTTMETKDNKILKHVKTCWISILPPYAKIYKTSQHYSAA